MNARAFLDVLKDVGANGVHAVTAIGNEAGRKRRDFKQVLADETRRRDLDDGSGGLDADIEDSEGDIVKCTVAKIDEGLGLVFGFAIVCKKDGEPYFDLQRDESGAPRPDHIPEDAMLAAAVDFMQHSRMAKEMHRGDANGSIVFAFPLTTDVAKALDIVTKTTGLLIAMKPNDPAVLAKFRDGTYTGFSIGGSRVRDEEIADA